MRRFQVSFQDIFGDRRRLNRRSKAEPVPFPDRRQFNRCEQSTRQEDLLIERSSFISYAKDWNGDASSTNVMTGETSGEDHQELVGLHAAHSADGASALADRNQPSDSEVEDRRS
jgi:hypothetical protein